MSGISEATLETTVLTWLENFGYDIEHGPDIAFDGVKPERDASANYTDVVLIGRLRESLERINPEIPREAIDEAVRKITRTESPSLIENNRRFHRMLTDSVDVEVISEDEHGSVRHVEDAGV